jgi:hypothetical protein
MKVATLADLYAQADPVKRVHKIIERQMERLRDYVWKFCGGPDKVPRFPKWSDLGKFVPKGDEFDF